MPNNIVDAMNNLRALSKPVYVRLNSVGDVVALGAALQLFAHGAEKNGEPGIAARMNSLWQQVTAHTPDDWDCGDPTCEACREAREERATTGDGFKRSRMFEPDGFFVIEPEGGEA